ncbi:MAG: CBS domain-containing protein, partial [Thermodesulfobacteriota bacterium]|nr:CBS domain-containing protein [Thermodesulfobacteriota bacterium]
LQTLLRSRIDPLKKAKDMMSSPVIFISPQEPIKKAATMMTKYNINVLIVIDEKGNIAGYITRQVVEKAVFFELGHLQVKEYMNIEFFTVGPDASLKSVQDLIIKNKLRVLPVIKNGDVLGVITRTDLLNILVGGPVIPDFLYDSRHASNFVKKKNMAAMIENHLPRRIVKLFKEFGKISDMLGYNAYLVGGLVRDIFLKHENFDVDIVIEGDGIRFAHEFERHHEVRVRSHRKFGTAVIIFPDGFKVDVATARIEYYESPASSPVVEMSSLKMDLFRRDFTINSLAIQLNRGHYGILVDYFGGQKDIKEKVIRVLHNLSFVEDPTRVLRAIRFEQRFGFKIGKLTLALIKNAVNINSFKELSGRRLFFELKLLLMENEPIQAIERMDNFNLLQFISPEIKFTKSLKVLLENIRGVISWYYLLYLKDHFEPWKVYWYGLTSSLDAKAMHRLAERMQMEDHGSQRMISQRLEIIKALKRLYSFRGDNNYYVYTLLHPYDTEILLYMMAKTRNEKAKKQFSNYFTRLKETKIRLRGRDLENMGYKPGPMYKEIFDRLMEARLNSLISTKEDEIRFVKETFGRPNNEIVD